MSEKIIYVVGIGPGNIDFITLEAKSIIENADFIIGYTKYVEIVKQNFPSIPAEKYLQTGMTKEIERCQKALEKANENNTVCIVCSGDSGVYGMASLVLELAVKFPQVKVQVVAGVTAALSGGAILGSPLTCDFITISLSDYLMPSEKIEKRLRCSSMGDLVTVLYNAKSKTRPNALENACKILLEEREEKTVCAVVKNIGRKDCDYFFCTLKELSNLSNTKTKFEVDMFCTVFIGNSETKLIKHQNRFFMVNPRGYEKRM